MDESTSCTACQHDNPPENRFCGSCGNALADSRQMVSRREDSPTATVRTLPAKLGPTGKALAVGLTALAAEASLLWLRRRVERASHLPRPTIEDSKVAIPGYLVGQSLEEVYVWLQEGDHQSRILSRREVRSFGTTRPYSKQLGE